MKYVNIHTHCLIEKDTEIAVVNLSGESRPSFHGKQYYSFGIHPWCLTAENAGTELKHLTAIVHGGIDAIGEVGFDKLRGPEMRLQEEVFLKIIKLSEESSKPLIIHCVKAWEQLLHARKLNKTTVPWIIHGFHGSLQLAQQLLEHGLYLSFGQKLLQSDVVKEVFSVLPLDRIFMETDDAPIDIKSMFDCAADLHKISVEQFKDKMWRNFKTIFSGNNKL